MKVMGIERLFLLFSPGDHFCFPGPSSSIEMLLFLNSSPSMSCADGHGKRTPTFFCFCFVQCPEKDDHDFILYPFH